MPLLFAEDTATIADMEVRNHRHDPLELLTRAVQPLLWLLVFGKVMAAVPDGGRLLARRCPGVPVAAGSRRVGW